jgi:2-polyprenyl-3-methyl-5-hydroxy-6-metoxy-1,4-benzoquinol methylase
MDVLLPDRLKAVWGAVEHGQLSVEDATRQQEQLIDEYRAVWHQALDLQGHAGPEHAALEELAAYFSGIDRVELERRCMAATTHLKADWPEGGEKDERAVEQFYDANDAHIFDLMWWHTLRDDTSPLAYVVALDFARRHDCRRYLDFGSGVGSGAILFARHGLVTTLADISATLLRFARWRFARRGLPATFLDLKASALPHDAFDMITAMDVFEHLTDPIAAADQLCAALKVGGYLFGRFAAEPDENRPQHIVLDFRPTLARFEALGFVPVWRDEWLWGHQVFQKTSGW